MTGPKTIWWLVRYLGPGWLAFRVRYALRRRLGWLRRRSPRASWGDLPAAFLAPSAPPPVAPPEAFARWGGACAAGAAAILKGEFVLFFHHRLALGFPPDWRRNPFTGETAPADRHWSELGDFAFGDIKAIWEPSRFAWAFTLARAFARTRDARLAEGFWRLFEDWCAHNPPNAGANWKCGQEASFRLFAASFAVRMFGGGAAASPARRDLWARFVLATGRRIAANLDYALSQGNNHGVSECVGLLTAGRLLADGPEAGQWRELGCRRLQSQLAGLVYEDGAFSQHSLVYHRVMVQDLCWAAALWRGQGEAPPDWLAGALRRALDFLAVLVEAGTGGAPLYGANDGSDILPLSECAYDDFRPAVQAGYALLDGERIYPSGPWDEAAFWLAGRDPAALPSRPREAPERWHAPAGGCFQWRSGAARLFLRCPTRFRHRPAQADMLHVDWWWRGRPVAHDAGSFSYNAPGPLGGALGKAAAHNVPTVNGVEPLRRATRFLALPWPEGSAHWDDAAQEFCATHQGNPDARLKRCVTRGGKNSFVVHDAIALDRPGRVRLHWLLTDAAWELADDHRSATAVIAGEALRVRWSASLSPQSVNLARAVPGSARGWWSRHYLAAEPAVSLELLFDVPERVEVTTCLEPV